MTDIVWDGIQRGYIPQEPLTISPKLPLHKTTDPELDPVTFEVIRYSLLNTNVEHGQTLQRLCVSPVTMLTRDFQPSIMTENGDLVFLGPYLQYFSNAQSLTVKWILENRSDDPGIEPGDMFVSNDPYVGTPHQPDTIVAAPVFAGDELFCWVANVLHHTDVGGSVVGSFCVDATDMFSDPPAFPPFKLVSRGKVRPDLEDMFVRQSRVPMNVRMDMRAAVSANLVAVQKIEALIARYGAASVKTVMNGVLDAGEKTFVDRLAGIPDGEWSHRLYTEAAHTGDTGTYAYQLTIRKEGSKLYVDNAGTDPQTGAINVTYAGLCGAFFAALTASMTADLAGAYGGVYRRVEFDPTPGTLSCADYPAAVSPSGIFTMETLISLSGSVISKMLACATEDVQALAIGPAHAAFYGLITAGSTASGEGFIATNANNMVGALGSTPFEDGLDFGGHFWIPEGMSSNIEELELLWPTLFLYRRGTAAGADGAGEFRGGRTLLEGAIPWKVPGMAAAVYIDESFPKTVGPFGGNPGTAGHFRLKHQTDVAAVMAAGTVPTSLADVQGVEQAAAAKGPMLMMGADTIFEWSGANGVGYGDPMSRLPQTVADDVAGGALTSESARIVYAVALDNDGSPDIDATATARREVLTERLATSSVPSDTAQVSAEADIQRISGDLGFIRNAAGEPVSYATITGRADLGPVGENFKLRCAVVERQLHDVGAEFNTTEDRPGWSVLFREYLCPITGIRVDSEIVRPQDQPLHDIKLAVPAR